VFALSSTVRCGIDCDRRAPHCSAGSSPDSVRAMLVAVAFSAGGDGGGNPLDGGIREELAAGIGRVLINAQIAGPGGDRSRG